MMMTITPYLEKLPAKLLPSYTLADSKGDSYHQCNLHTANYSVKLLIDRSIKYLYDKILSSSGLHQGKLINYIIFMSAGFQLLKHISKCQKAGFTNSCYCSNCSFSFKKTRQCSCFIKQCRETVLFINLLWFTNKWMLCVWVIDSLIDKYDTEKKNDSIETIFCCPLQCAFMQENVPFITCPCLYFHVSYLQDTLQYWS